jgi:SAM-dependent methyltransferase
MQPLYDRIGVAYSDYRRPDPRLAALINDALAGAGTVVNIGAGAGSYEPKDRAVVAVEPSKVMIAQRASDAAPVVRASAMNLPFADAAFDAALAIFTIHHWPDVACGLKEMARVARQRCIILTWDPQFRDDWLTRDYFPQIPEVDEAICPPLEFFAQIFSSVAILPVPVPYDCTDGFLRAYWRRPEAYFEQGVRRAISAFDGVDVREGLARLRRDLDDGSWARRNAAILECDARDVGYRLIIAEP